MEKDLSKFTLDFQTVDEEKYKQLREELVAMNREMHFSAGIELSPDEEKVQAKLAELRGALGGQIPNPVLRDFYDSKPLMESSDLYAFLHAMPKGGVFHVHLTAACHVDYLLELSHEDIVFYNPETKVFRVEPTGAATEEGYRRCSELRTESGDSAAFDEGVRDAILLNRAQISSRHSETVWQNFQHKFNTTFQLYNYGPFFKRAVVRILKQFASENLFVVELKHISQMVFGEDRQPVGLNKELDLFKEALDEARKEYPQLELRVILQGLKLLPKEHSEGQLRDTLEGLKLAPEIFAGYDLVCEEDTTPQVIEFARLIIEGSKRGGEGGLPLFLHAGESVYRENTNLYDAIILGTRRIGHGNLLNMNPALLPLLKERDICVEICPISSYVLGYCLDLRVHPSRYLLNRGVAVTLNCDDPGFWGYEGVTLDYTYATVAWQLDLRDLKKFAMNGIQYSSLDDKRKQQQFEHFKEKWDAFISQQAAKY